MLMMIRTILLVGILLAFVGLIPTTIAMTVVKDHVDILKQSAAVTYPQSIQIDEVINHLSALENIATSTNGNRAVRTLGFNATLDYITNYLSLNTDFRVTTTFFNMRTFQLLANPTFSSAIDGVRRTYTYSSNLAAAEFYYAQFSTSANINSDVLLTAIPNEGCEDADWLAAQPSPAGLVALVKRGTCTFESKAVLASKYNVAALLIYNDGSTPNNIQPILINVGQNNRIPVLFLSYTVGEALAAAANDPTQTVTVRLTILTDSAFNPVGNICADTPTGDPTQTIVIGSHSDSVTAGPGINDNGKFNN
jgi:Zn-dependent M28 family amino/carboxypeptidase